MESAAIDEFRSLQSLVNQRGLLEKQPGYYARKILFNLALLAFALFLVKTLHRPWATLLNAAFLAFVFAQLGFIVHDSGHQEILHSPSGNEAIGLLHSNLLLGFSYSWWLHKHNHHHSAPNHITADPDIDLVAFAFSKEQVASKRGFARFSVRYQHFSFFPLSLLEAYYLKFDSFRFVLHRKVNRPLAEVSCLFLHFCWYFGLLYLFLGGPQALLFILGHHAFLGLYLTLVFAPNHQGMPLLYGKTGMNFLREQVLTSRDIKKHPGVDFCLGGLACQIEHHLFPAIPSHKLRRAQKVIRAYCSSLGIPHHEVSLFQSYHEIYTNLRQMSRLAAKDTDGDTVTD